MRECAGQEVGIYIYFKMPLDVPDMYGVDHKKRHESRDDAGASALGKRRAHSRRDDRYRAFLRPVAEVVVASAHVIVAAR
jgi:hypothetical protein